MAYCYQYPRPAVTTDCLIFSKAGKNTKLLLIQRKNEPYKNQWAFPGGFVEIDENLEDAAKRELLEETCIKEIELQQLCTAGKPDRDPRGRTISVVYFGFTNDATAPIKAASDAKNIQWFDIDDLPKLAFDHDEIIDFAKNKLDL